jgi:hypothetical protein
MVVTKDADDVDDMAKRACKLAGREALQKRRTASLSLPAFRLARGARPT